MQHLLSRFTNLYPVWLVSIEVGMQNGGMAAMLARKNFPMEPLAAVPAVFSGLVQNLVGAVVAAYWRQRPVTPPAAVAEEIIVMPGGAVKPGNLP